MKTLTVLEDNPLQPSDESKKCKGLWFRGKVNEYVLSDGTYRIDKRLVPLKRMSCKGCEKCDWISEYIQDDFTYGNLELPEIKNKSLYELKVVDYSTCWETGVCDDVTFGYTEVIK